MEGPAIGLPRSAISGLGSPADCVLAPGPGSVQEVETHNTKAVVNAREVRNVHHHLGSAGTAAPGGPR